MNKYIKSYKLFLNESGNLFDNVSGIKQKDIEYTINALQKQILSNIGLEEDGTDYCLIGSAGKKANIEDLSGDLDLAVSVDKIAAYFQIHLEDTLDFIDKKIQSLGYKTSPHKGFQQCSIAFPIKGNKQLGFVQIDLMLSTSLEWSKFVYHSPDYRKAESKYKGSYRNHLLMSCIKMLDKNIVKYTDKGEKEEVEGLVLRMNQGMVKVRKTFLGKKGLTKIPALLKEYDKLITNVPEKLISIVFGDNYSIKDVETFEKLYELVFFKDSNLKKFRDEIREEFKIIMKKSNLPLPSELQ